MGDSDVLGPIGYLIVEYPGTNKMTGNAFTELLALVDRGLIRVLDLRFVMRAADGSLAAMELSDIDADGQFDFGLFAGVSSGLLDDSDLQEAAAAIAPDSAAAIMVYENHWAGPFVQALREAGANLVSAGFIPQETLLATLDALGA
ncbi:MAG TPA: DUF6325 family protein [Acidimicrobiales bacterium]|jgi:hypothetical protein|nr:DUF6325 family protein [Acidimicrobiales bacterium]